MDQDRELGESTVIELYSSTGLIQVGEIDSIEETHQTEQKTTRPLGQRWDHQQTVHKGWELAIKGGKIDESVPTLAQNLQDALIAGKQAPRYRLTRTVEHFDGSKTQYIYDRALLYGFKDSTTKSDEEATFDFSAFAGKRKMKNIPAGS